MDILSIHCMSLPVSWLELKYVLEFLALYCFMLRVVNVCCRYVVNQYNGKWEGLWQEMAKSSEFLLFFVMLGIGAHMVLKITEILNLILVTTQTPSLPRVREVGLADDI